MTSFFPLSDGCGGRRAIAAFDDDAASFISSLQLALLSLPSESETLTSRAHTALSNTSSSRRSQARDREKREGGEEDKKAREGVDRRARPPPPLLSSRGRGAESEHALPTAVVSLQSSMRPSATRCPRTLGTAGVDWCRRAVSNWLLLLPLSQERERDQRLDCLLAPPRCGRLLLGFPSTRADRARAIANRRRLGERKSTRRAAGARPYLVLKTL